MLNDWSPASKKAARPENWFAKFRLPPKWAARIFLRTRGFLPPLKKPKKIEIKNEQEANEVVEAIKKEKFLVEEVKNGKRINGIHTEKDIFKVIGLHYRPPSKRS